MRSILLIGYRSGSFRVIFQGVDERPQMKIALRVYEMQAHGRGEREVAILLDGVVRRNESRRQDHDVNQRQGKKRNPEFPTHAQSHSTRIRGSAQCSSTSASRLPATRKTVENSTVATTT